MYKGTHREVERFGDVVCLKSGGAELMVPIGSDERRPYILIVHAKDKKRGWVSYQVFRYADGTYQREGLHICVVLGSVPSMHHEDRSVDPPNSANIRIA